MLDGDRPRRRPGYQVEVLEGEAVLYHPASAQLTHLNRAATLIWRLCDGQRTVAEICHLLTSAYPDAPEVPADVREALGHLGELGALTLTGQTADARAAG